MFEMDRAEIEAIVMDAVAALPDEFRDQIANLEFAVEDWARPDDYARTRTPGGSTILGVYRGIPLTKRGSGYHMILPDSIVIFQQPLQRMAANADDLAARVRHVVKHEIAHYFGISDDRLREIDAY